MLASMQLAGLSETLRYSLMLFEFSAQRHENVERNSFDLKSSGVIQTIQAIRYPENKSAYLE